MTKKADFDKDAVHRHFSSECFNKAWELLDKTDRSTAEDEEMLHLSIASHWHWTQRPDCTATNISVAYWQMSRIYAVLGQAENAKRYAERCLAVSRDGNVPPFYLAYAYEALARAERLAGNREQMAQYREEALRLAEQVSDPEDKKWLADDLAADW